MPDPHAMVRMLDELFWALRRDGVDISTGQAIDAVRAVALVGVERRSDVRDAVAAVVVHRARDRERFDAAFDRFFRVDQATERARSLWGRLSARGFDEGDLKALRALLAKLAGTGTGDFIALGALLDRGADLDRAVASSGILRGIDAYSGPMLGFLTHRLLLQVGSTAAQRLLASLRPHLVDSFGSRADALADALSLELERAGEDIRADVRKTHETRIAEMERQRSRPQTATIPFVELTDSEVEEVRREVRRFAEGLRGGARVRARRRTRHGRIDVHRTLRLAVRTGGVPMQLAREERPRDRPKIVLLCDVSESVRAVACFLLEFTYAVQDLFHKARSFVFVSDLVETTPLFAQKPVRAAIALAWQGGIAGLGDNSNYGRVLRTFEAEYARELDGRTTVVVLGDGRTNYHDAAPDVLDRIRDRSRALLWLCPEPRSQWGQGDSAMGAYGPKCTAVYEVRCAADLQLAAHAIVARG